MLRSKIAIIVGTRPEIVKMQPVIVEVESRKGLELLFIHTGQHYDWNMSDSFLKDLELPKPDVFLDVKSGSHGTQIARTIARTERVLEAEKPDIVLVEGDTNSALGSALAASKLKIPIGHVEAGCRSFDRNMPEEINRTLIGNLASIHFAPTKTCVRNLMKEGISKEHIYLTGHPIVDLLHLAEIKMSERMVARFGLKPRGYYLATVHREENVDIKNTLEDILGALSVLAQDRPVFFPIHPRTIKFVRKFKLQKYLKNLMMTDPVSYYEALSLVKYARVILTDSGGIQQEAAQLGTPCITLRNTTEWVETVDSEVNFLSGNSKGKILLTLKKLEDNMDKILTKFTNTANLFGRIGAARKIVDIAENPKSCSEHYLD